MKFDQPGEYLAQDMEHGNCGRLTMYCLFELVTPTSSKGAMSAAAQPHRRAVAEHVENSLESSAPSSFAAPPPADY